MPKRDRRPPLKFPGPPISVFEQNAMERAMKKVEAGKQVLGRPPGITKTRWRRLSRLAREIAERR